MNPILTKLGVPPGIQAFFDTGELLFDYSGHFEHFGIGFHHVPTTPNFYIAGSEVSKELILASSVMEAMAFLTITGHRYLNLDNLAVIAIGNLPHPGQFNRISNRWQKRKITMVFGKDILGRLTDIKVAAGIRNKVVRFTMRKNRIDIEYNHKHYRFDQDSLSLNQFEKSAGLRSNIRTCKPKKFDTYLEQLKHDANR